ncbi:MAG: L-threonylcarbamoyladenylate synthase [Candidatus Pacearchaeota archaeon]
MKIINKEQIEKGFVKEILAGKIFVYPTDTIYGLGCDATNNKAVEKIRKIKDRELKPFSIIAPSKEWIEKNCFVPAHAKEWLSLLPGPYTLLLKIKNKKIVANSVIFGETIGVRIPNHPITKLIQSAGVPFITTSVNISGQPHINSITQIPLEISEQVDFIIDEGVLNNKPSTVVDLTSKEEKIIR